ncbi:MAG: Flp family type IVb pilin [Candidatus Brocadiales bacterium]
MLNKMVEGLCETMRRLVTEKEGAASVEYALLLAAISVAMIAVVIVAFRSALIDIFESVVSYF